MDKLERRALNLAKNGARIIKGCIPQDKAVNRYIAVPLVEAGLAVVIEGRLRITKAGLRALRQPIPEDPDVYLKQRDGLTTSRACALLSEGPVIDPATLDGFWREQALRNKAAVRDGREHARALRRSSRNWPTVGPCGPVVVSFEGEEIREEAA